MIASASDLCRRKEKATPIQFAAFLLILAAVPLSYAGDPAECLEPADSVIASRFRCYADNLPKEEINRIMEETQLLPPSLLEGDLRYFTASMCWTGNGSSAPPPF